MDAVIRQTLHVTLRKVNRSAVVAGGGGSDASADSIQSFFVTNLTVVFSPEGIVAGRRPTGSSTFDYTSGGGGGGGGGGGVRTGGTAEGDKAGAGYYVLAVLLVYSMSVVALLASHIKRKHEKILEDREIHKYLREFQVVKEKSSRDSYQNLKSAVIARLSKERASGHHAYRNLSRSVLPLLAVSIPDRSSSSSSSGPPAAAGVWESHVGFYVGGGGGGGGGTHPSSALPTLRETNVDDVDCSTAREDDDDRTSAGSWTEGGVHGGGGGHWGGPRTRQQKMMATTTKKSGSLDATTTTCSSSSSWRNGPFRGSTAVRWPPARKVQSEIMIDPVLLCPSDGPPAPVPGISAGAGARRPVCIDVKGVSCRAFDYSPGTEEVSPMTDDNRPETETMSLDDDVISIDASSQTLPHDVSDAQYG